MTAEPTHKFDARSAELLARQINTAFMNACGYGIEHPLTERACRGLHASLKRALGANGMLSVILDRGSLFVEKHPVAQHFNPKRMVDSFNEIGLESITFDTGVSESDVGALVEALSKLGEYDSVDAVSADLKQKQSGTIRFNHIVYRKVTSDQKVVDGNDPGADPGERLNTQYKRAPVSAAGARVLDQLDSFFSLGELAGDPDSAAERLAATSNDDDATRAKLVDHLKRLVREVESGNADVEGLSPEELFSAMNALRSRVKKSVAVHEDVDRIMAENGEVVSEVDELTYSTLVSLVREEYRGGNFSVQRMAQIINRMLPEPGDLKRLLPRLRKGLLEEGMSAEQYAELVHELSNELRGEHLVSALETGAENVGLDVDELVRQIQEDPTEAARLVVLASELRQGGANDGEQLSSAFTDYIERVSQKLALGSFAGDAVLDSGTLGEQLERVQKELLVRMNDSGLASDAAQQLERQLEQRRPQLAEDSKLALFDRMLAGGEEVTDTLVLDWLQKQVENPDELEHLREPLRERLQSNGYSVEQADGLFDQLAGRMKSDAKPARIPSSVLSVANTALFLQHEVKSAQRYGNPFSVIKLMVEWLAPVDGRPPRRARRSDMLALLPSLYYRIVRLARDLDLVGSLEKSMRAVPVLILPMTEEPGARVFRGRLLEVLAEFPFTIDGTGYYLITTVTVAGFDNEIDPDANSFVRRVNELHSANRAETARQVEQGVTSPGGAA